MAVARPHRAKGERRSPVQKAGFILLALSLLAATNAVQAWSAGAETADVLHTSELPEEARETLALIKQGGPFPFSRDGAVFANREGRLPPAPLGSYREYTVRTPGSRHRGASRIIAAGVRQFWYTVDHYRSFRRIVE